MKIAIIGCGYIGSSLASALESKDHELTITTKTLKHFPQCKNIGKKHLLFEGHEEEKLQHILQENEVIIITISEQFINHYKDTFLNFAQNIKKIAISVKEAKTLIFTSDTIIYGEQQGLWVDENTPPNPITEEAKILLQTEKVFLSLKEYNWHITIIRLSEIYGPQKTLSSILALLHPGDHYTNMVHKDDVVAAIEYLLEHKIEGIFNVSDDSILTREQLYQLLYKKMKLPTIEQETKQLSHHNGNKRVSNHKIKAAGYHFLHPERTRLL